MTATSVSTATRPAGSTGRAAPRVRLRVIAAALVVGGIVVACVASVAFGSRVVGLHEVLRAFDGAAGDDPSIAQAAVRSRVPRTVLGLVVGAALGVAGALMQGVTRNPLADPGILGINNGAALAVVLGISTGGLTSITQYIWLALLGAAVTAVAVYAIGSAGRGGATPLRLALAGAAVAAALSSLVTALLLPRPDVVNQYRFWQIGGLGGARLPELAQVAPLLLVGAALALVVPRALNALALGDDVAVALGQRVGAVRVLAGLGAVLLAGTATALAGPIGFVGLVVPHVARLVAGADYRWIVPLSAGLGAMLLVAADVIGRVATRPSDIEVGIVTAVLGGPFFIALVRRQRLREL